MYTKVRKIQPYSTLMTLDEVKRALGVFDDFDDEELALMKDTAFKMAEAYCYRQFSPSTVTLSRDDGEQVFFIPYNDNVIIQTVELDGAETNNFSFNSVTGKLRINEPYDELLIQYSCGMLELPIAINRGIKYLISTMYNSGQDFVSAEVHKIPLRATHFFDTEKNYVI